MKVILAIDGSESSQYAAEFLCRLPHDNALDIEVVSSINGPDVSISTSTKAWLPQYLSQLETDAVNAFEEVKACFEGSTANVSFHKTEGHPGHAIVNRAEEVKADLIVIGARGHSTAARMLLGSVSDYVGRHSSTSVLTVRPPGEDVAPRDGLKVALAYDESDPSKRALDAFQAFSWSGSVEVEVVSVVHLFPQFPGEGEELLREHVKQDCLEAKAKVDAVAASLTQQHVNAKGVVLTAEHAGEGLVAHTAASGCDLIVLGNTSRSLIPRLFLGSVSSYVLRHAKQSVWIAR